MEDRGRFERLIGYVLLGAIAAGCLLVLRPFLSAILWAAILSFSTWPVMLWLTRRLGGRRTLAALLLTLGMLLLIFIPLVVVGAYSTEFIRNAIVWVESNRERAFPPPPGWVQRLPLVGAEIQNYWLGLGDNTEKILQALTPHLQRAGLWLLQHSLDFVGGILQVGLSLFITFYFYRDGAGLVAQAQQGIQRIGGERGMHLFKLAGRTVQSVVYGLVGTGLAQGLVAGIGFWIAGVPSALLLALATFFFSVLPVGPPIIWLSAAGWLFLHDGMGWGIFMLLYGFLAISGIDNIVKPYLISRGARLSFALMLMGVLGGVLAFGFVGVFLGPVLIAVGNSLLLELVRARKAAVAADGEAPAATR